MTSEESDVVGKTNTSCSAPEGPGCDSSELDCTVCFCPYDNVFKAPKVLSCHHTFCLECLARMNVSSVENKTLVCPLCREETQLKTGKGLPDLPNNLELIGKLALEMQGTVSVRFNRSKGHLWVKKKMDPTSLIKPSKVDSVSLSLDVGRPPSRVRTEASRLLLSTCSCYTAIASMVVVTVVLVLSGILIVVLVPRTHHLSNTCIPPPQSSQIYFPPVGAMTSEESDVVGKTNTSCSAPEGPGCDSSELDCTVCFCPYDNVFKAPKVLSCHHTFCLECLARMNVSSVENKTLVCPLCREETQLKTGKGLPDLPNNLELIGKLAPEMQGAISVRFNRSKGRLWVKKKMDPASLIKPSKVDSVSLSLDVGRPPSRVRTEASRLLLSTCSCYTAIASMVVVTVVLVLSGILIVVLVPRTHHLSHVCIPPPQSSQIYFPPAGAMTSQESDVVGKTNTSCSASEDPGCDSSELDCTVCFCPYDNVFKAPKVLSCHHTFCLECLAHMNVSSVENKTLVCPLCREETQLKTGKGLPDLPNNLELIGKLAPEMQGAVSVRFNRSKGRLWVKKKMDPASLIKPSKVDSVSLSLDVGRPPSRVRTEASRLLLSTCSCYTAIASMVVVTGRNRIQKHSQ
ncbi:UNVERIFIED_CONTAM: hypothetical protein FKN15_045049 [Acipenser sinensis]